jgi:hypothetical protein
VGGEESIHLNIVICDDESRRDGWKQRLEPLFGDEHVVELLDEGFKDSFGELTKRRGDARGLLAEKERVSLAELPDEDAWEKETAFDHADILLVDYDLFKFQPDEYLTGAIVAYMARCYSGCGLIVGVNELGPNPFDLTLIDSTSSFADLTIGEVQLDNHGLWFGISDGGAPDRFRPWSWPALFDAAERQARRAEDAFGRLDQHVLEVAGLDAVEDRLPRSALGWLERAGEAEERTTLDDLARGKRLGYRRGDEAPSRQSVARVAAARLAKWVETAVLPLQDVLIDAPHLVQRNAALLDVEHLKESQSSDWNVTTAVPAAPEACGLRAEVLPHMHTAPDWLSRPAFYWPKISAASELPGIAEPYRVPAVDMVFCEDVSAFLRREDARRFVSKLDSSSPVRWLADPDKSGHTMLSDVEYQPRTRLAL